LYNGITKQEILSTLDEFIGAGFETVSTTLEWIVLYLSYHKHVQERVQAEIDNVISGSLAVAYTLQNTTVPFFIL
jgi:cytochrome P450